MGDVGLDLTDVHEEHAGDRVASRRGYLDNLAGGGVIEASGRRGGVIEASGEATAWSVE